MVDICEVAHYRFAFHACRTPCASVVPFQTVQLTFKYSFFNYLFNDIFMIYFQKKLTNGAKKIKIIKYYKLKENKKKIL